MIVTERKCPNHIRGCRNMLAENYARVRCEECLQKEREQEKKRRDVAKAKRQEQEMEGNETGRVCTICCGEYPIEHFHGLKGNSLTKTCQKCRDINRVNDAKRDKEHRNELARICSKNPEKIVIKEEWKENNYETCVEIWQRYRQRHIYEDVEEYLKSNAENAKRWREVNREKYFEFLKKSKTDINRCFSTYKRCATERNIPFELTYDEYQTILTTPCYYCGEFSGDDDCLTRRRFEMEQPDGLNFKLSAVSEPCANSNGTFEFFKGQISGIDRINSNKSYNVNNITPCCWMCNMMKNTLNQYTFIRRVEHILTFQYIVPGRLFPEVFTDYGTDVGDRKKLYNRYKKGARERNIEFGIDLALFKQFVSEDCYLCGKSNTGEHQNGIDRFDNDVGYFPTNCKPCCFNCNLMKRDHDFDNFVRKMLLIYNLHKDDVFECTEITRCMEPSNKMTKKELAEYQNLQREMRICRLKERYTDEEIKKNAVRVAQERRDKQQLLATDL